jgi:glycosyltransferase involved in cell wall biosynthesis
MAAPMRILYVVQRYGDQIVGGSEAACRDFAEHLAGRGHHVEVLTSCAHRYTDWADHYPPGRHEVHGVTVWRLPVVERRRPERFSPIHGWIVNGPRPVPHFEQVRWARHMGPDLDGLRAWLADNHHRFDVVVFMTYLYATTTTGLPYLAGRVPTVLQPTAHDEPPLWTQLYDTIFRLPDGYLFFTPEEREVVRRRFSLEPVGEVVGIGVDLDDDADPDAFRRQYGLGDRPYLLYLGRIDPSKGSLEAYRFFEAYKARNPDPLTFVVVGESVVDLPDHPDVIRTGYLDERGKRSALAGALALLQPSYFESFSIVLCESWVQRRPALVQGASTVLAGQARRARGALPYRGFAQFEAAAQLLVERPELGDELGRNGRRYVEDRYRWDVVLEEVEAGLTAAVDRFGRRRHGAGQWAEARGPAARRLPGR